MKPHDLPISEDPCCAAIKARNVRCDGCFFTPVMSKGSACQTALAPRPVGWSIQAASYIQAHQADNLLDETEGWLGRQRLPASRGAATRSTVPGQARGKTPEHERY